MTYKITLFFISFQFLLGRLQKPPKKMAQSWASSIFILSWIICVTSSFQHEENIPTKYDSQMRHRHSCNGGQSLAASVCLPKGYNLGEVPKIPIEVLTIFEINNIREINDKKMTVTFEFYQEMTWIDNRIQTNFSSDIMKLGGMPLTSNQLKHIWTPGLWVQSLFDFKLRSVFEPSVGLYVHRKTKCQLINCNDTNEADDGVLQTAVTYNFEARATIFCNFAYFRYPMDTQTCDFVMSSAYPFPDIVMFRLEHAEFGTTFNNSNTDDFVLDIKFNSIHNGFSGISFVLTLQRRLLPYIMRYYLPCVAMVIVSFINFLISLNSIPARVALLVTLFLTVTNILIAQQVRFRS